MYTVATRSVTENKILVLCAIETLLNPLPSTIMKAKLQESVHCLNELFLVMNTYLPFQLAAV